MKLPVEKPIWPTEAVSGQLCWLGFHDGCKSYFWKLGHKKDTRDSWTTTNIIPSLFTIAVF